MQAQDELERFAAARPAILSRPETVIDQPERDRILRQILSTPRGQSRPRSAATPRAGSRARLLRIAGVPRAITVAAACALAAGGIATGVGLGMGSGGQSAGPEGSGHQGSGAPGAANTASTVVVRTMAALSQVHDSVLQSHLVLTDRNGRIMNIYETWVYGDSVRRQLLTPDGSLNTDWSVGSYWDGASHDRCRTRWINYWNRTWMDLSCPHSTAGPQDVSVADQVARLLKWDLDNGLLKVTRQRVINGQKAIGLLLVPPRPGQKATTPPLSIQSTAVQFALLLRSDVPPPRGVTDTIWVSATTYLPLRETVINSPTAAVGLGAPASVTDDYSWLPANPVNLAKVEPPAVPAGFTRAQPVQLPIPVKPSSKPSPPRH